MPIIALGSILIMIFSLGGFFGARYSPKALGVDNNELNACLMEVSELKAELDEETRYNMENERIMRELVRDCEAELKCKVTFK